MRQTDAAILAMRKIRALLEGQWHNARWQPADFMDIRMPLSRVRTSLDKALSFSRDRQKMKPQDMLSVQVALRNSGVEPDALKVLMRGLAQGALLDKEMLSAIDDARPPLPGEDLAKLLKVMFDDSRKTSAIIYLSCLAATIAIAIEFPSLALLLPGRRPIFATKLP